MDRSHPGLTEQDVTAIDARRRELHVAWFVGYRKGDVDPYLDEVLEAMRSRIREKRVSGLVRRSLSPGRTESG